MRKSIFLILFLSISVALFSQQIYKVKGCIKNFPYNKVYLSAIDAHYNTVIDSCLVYNGCFDFYLDSAKKTGMYSIILDKRTNAYVRIIYNKENIEFYSVYKFLLDSMRFTDSDENKLFYVNAKAISLYSKKTDLLNRIGIIYNENEPFAKKAQEEIEVVNKAYENYVTGMMGKDDGTLFRKIFRAQQQVNIPSNLTGEIRMDYIREHYFDNVDLSCEALIRTDILPGLISNYLSFLESKTFTRTEQEVSYLKGVESLLTKSRINKEIFRLVTGELLNIFQYGDYDIIGAYINETYAISGMCKSEDESTQLLANIERIKRVSVGKPAPEIEFTDQDDKMFRLSEMNAPYTLIVFWSSTCPHCTRMLPVLSNIYKSRNGNSFEVIAISNDADKNSWLNVLNSGDYTWINYCESKEGDRRIFRDYNISGTPTFFLLNDDKIIISKPYTIEEAYSRLLDLDLLK